MKIFYRICRLFFKGLFFLFYRHKVYGVENIPEGAALIAPNHVSYWDPPLVGVSCPVELAFLAKEGLFKVPILSWIIRHLNAHPVTGSARDLSSIRMICKLLNEGEKVVIFPEGERTVDGKLTTIKPGIGMLALRGKAPIVPVYIEGAYEIWPITRRFPKLWGRTTCTFGEPIYLKPYLEMNKKEAQKAIADAVFDEISNLKGD